MVLLAVILLSLAVMAGADLDVCAKDGSAECSDCDIEPNLLPKNADSGSLDANTVSALSRCCSDHYRAWKERKNLCLVNDAYCLSGDMFGWSYFYNFDKDPCTDEPMSEVPDPYVPFSIRHPKPSPPPATTTAPTTATFRPSWDNSCSGDPSEPRCSTENKCKCCFLQDHYNICEVTRRAMHPEPIWGHGWGEG